MYLKGNRISKSRIAFGLFLWEIYVMTGGSIRTIFNMTFTLVGIGTISVIILCGHDGLKMNIVVSGYIQISSEYGWRKTGIERKRHGERKKGELAKDHKLLNEEGGVLFDFSIIFHHNFIILKFHKLSPFVISENKSLVCLIFGKRISSAKIR